MSALLVAGFAAWPAGLGVERWLWGAATAGALVPSVARVVADLRRRRYGADLLAVLALAGTLAVGEYLAGAVVALMVATGQVLEAAAARRAARDLSGLLERAPRQAHRRAAGGLVTVPVDEVGVDDEVVVLSGEIVPVDGTLRAEGVLDESALTGEPEPVVRPSGETVRSGTVNAGPAVDLTAAATAADSTYAGMVRLAEEAAAERAPIARLADRVAGWFLPLALLIAGSAWLVSRDAVIAVAVLVTATPCPLLLAVPIAVTGGMSRASRAGIVVRDGAALELLGRTTTLLLDKTGTVTEGRPEITDVVCAPGVTPEHALRLAAAVEQYSLHVLAAAVLRAASRAGVEVHSAEDVSESPGRGATGRVGGETVQVGRIPAGAEVPEWASAVLRRGRLDLATVIWVTVDGELTAALLGRDRIRPDAVRTMRRLHAAGVRRVVLLTGDRVDTSTEVAAMLGLDEVQAEATPEDKISRVRREGEHGTVVMVGDGINDAPALAVADVGIALGSRGSTAAVQSADAVIVDDRIDRLADAMEIARRARRVASQSGVIGTALSLAAMIVSALGALVPVAGALVQEAIDVAVIVNSLRVLRSGARRGTHPEADTLLGRFAAEHESLQPVRASVRQAADALSAGATPAADAAVRRAHRLLVDELLPHENAEETELYPVLGGVLGSPEETVTMSRGHAEIARLCRRLGRHLDTASDGIAPEQIDDLRATLYGLDAVLTLHFAQEEEGYFVLREGE
ncbi:heavy metal translocating P-type ATPase [Saccharomonospora cyanea NA-134]|uniref:Heavy metal translocating P-type ATPase n=1 Tax=Saccharomonospora cyanea NA-134 TaxID=882082 RepID=H5XJX3_9PSEU|nr:heavy metal translocating P-type ATPase [Saccharomonospora cyanea NA-134]